MDAAGEITPTLHTSMAEIAPGDAIGALPPESIVTAITVEEPLPWLMAGMSIWGFAVTAAVMFPVGLLAVAASPMIIARNFLIPAR